MGTGAAAGGTSGAMAGGNATANNFLTHQQAGKLNKEIAQCKAQSGGCSDEDLKVIRDKYLGLSNDNIDAVNSCIFAGDVACVNRLEGQAAGRGEVADAFPPGYTDWGRGLADRQDNVNTYGSVRGQQSLFGPDAQQAAEVARFRENNCSGMSPADCN